MTTPEKQRRREFLFIGLVGLVMATFVSLSIWQSHADAVRERESKAAEDRQTALFQECITSTVSDLVKALTTRSALTERDAASVTTLINDLLKAQNDEAKGRKIVERYTAEQAKIAKIRKENPFPPFPNGKCEFLTKGQKAATS